ncbi:uncharacterized protein LOC113233513 [Hyposmocoma kahamanoa]|uniref:uncharacterized protein LOC113233513 n=1 Tax=Hyposmocoma kahamanoa TaxID=1477025 RepID=UPI000E6D94C2|nr:uncharacterized protein LOC113233513 [Hyposmocoma kahamanoa]
MSVPKSIPTKNLTMFLRAPSAGAVGSLSDATMTPVVVTETAVSGEYLHKTVGEEPVPPLPPIGQYREQRLDGTEPMTYHWWFNSSTHSKHELTTPTMNTAQNSQSTFLYMVNTSSDYGWVQCSGSNSVGRQSKPCLFHILPADKPSSLKACEITNVTYESLTLNCTPGHDGGLRQSFLLQRSPADLSFNNKNEKDKRQQDETSNIPLTGTKESESVDSLDKNPDIIPLDGKISDSCSNKSSTTDYSSIRPLISKTPSDKYDCIPPNCDRFYDHNIDPCNQYIQVRPMEYRVRPNYQTNLAVPNLGPSIQSLGPMTSLGHMPHGNECHRQPYDKVYEDWLKYKNALPLNTSGLLPAEQLMPPEMYATPPPPAIYSNPSRNPLNLAQMPELEPRYHLEPRLMDRSCSNSPPVRFNTDNTVYFNKSLLDRHTNTLPHLKTRINGNSSVQATSDGKSCATKSTDTNNDATKMNHEV